MKSREWLVDPTDTVDIDAAVWADGGHAVTSLAGFATQVLDKDCAPHRWLMGMTGPATCRRCGTVAEVAA
jgi:hypothetical protein